MATANALIARLETAEPQFRTPPSNIEAEQALLGAILVNNDAYYRVSDFLEAGHFIEDLHRRIYEVATSLIKAGKVATPITMKTFLGDQDLGGITVSQYLARLAAEATTVINAEDYGRTIYDLAVRRNLINIGEDMVNVAFDAPVETSPRDQIEEAERRLYALAETGRYDGGFQRFSDALTAAIDMAAAAYKREGALSGISSGLIDLDKSLGGLQPSDLVILAGRPAMGKTSLVTNIAFNIAKAYRSEKQQDGSLKTVNGGIVGFFSLEMSAEQLATRILAEQSQVTAEQIRTGNLQRQEFASFARTADRLNSLPLYIDDTPGLTIAALRARARRLKRQKGIGMVIVDYLQLLQGTGKGSAGDNRVQEISEISRGLKQLAKELNVPVIGLSQLSRAVEQREDKRPQLSDLRESGSIEQDADIVLFIYREDYYLKAHEPKHPIPGDPVEVFSAFEEWEAKHRQIAGLAEVIVAKNRHGGTGKERLRFEGRFTKFSDLAEEDRLPELRG